MKICICLINLLCKAFVNWSTFILIHKSYTIDACTRSASTLTLIYSGRVRKTGRTNVLDSTLTKNNAVLVKGIQQMCMTRMYYIQ